MSRWCFFFTLSRLCVIHRVSKCKRKQHGQGHTNPSRSAKANHPRRLCNADESKATTTMTSLPLPIPVSPPEIHLPSWCGPAHASLLTLAYVGGFYVSPTIRKLSKDDPRAMRSRLRTAGVVTALGVAATGVILWKGQTTAARTAAATTARAAHGGYHWTLRFPQILLALGMPLPLSVPCFLTDALLPLKPGIVEYLSTHLIPALTYPLALTAMLFAGPLYVEYLYDNLPVPRLRSQQQQPHGEKGGSERKSSDQEHTPTQGAIEKIRAWFKSWWNLYGLRNFIVGPLTEEFIWRSCILAVSAYSGSSRSWLIFGTPLYFGLAHIHHAWEVYTSRGRTDAAMRFAVLQSTVQFAYTTVFGWYANWLWLRTGSVVAPLVSHTFCNIMGLPNPWSAARDHPRRRTSEWAVAGKEFPCHGANLELTDDESPRSSYLPRTHSRHRWIRFRCSPTDSTCSLRWQLVLASYIKNTVTHRTLVVNE